MALEAAAVVQQAPTRVVPKPGVTTTGHPSYACSFKSSLIMQTAICTLLALSVPGFAAAAFAPLHLHGAAHKARGLAEAAGESTDEMCSYRDDVVSSSKSFSSHV